MSDLSLDRSLSLSLRPGQVLFTERLGGGMSVTRSLKDEQQICELRGELGANIDTQKECIPWVSIVMLTHAVDEDNVAPKPVH